MQTNWVLIGCEMIGEKTGNEGVGRTPSQLGVRIIVREMGEVLRDAHIGEALGGEQLDESWRDAAK